MEIDLGTVLVLIRSVALAVITFVIGRYHDPSARYRWRASITALLICGGAAGWCLWGITKLAHYPSQWAWEIFPTMFVLAVTYPILRTEGNVAKLLPRLRWSHRP
jgi:hypothetical protein